jgi:chromosome segregation ATPase
MLPPRYGESTLARRNLSQREIGRRQAMTHSQTSAETSAEKLDRALARLAKALDQLERAVAVKLEDDHSVAELEEELDIMQDDRSRLALELDAALAHVSALEKARDEVLRRLDEAGDGVAEALGMPGSATREEE